MKVPDGFTGKFYHTLLVANSRASQGESENGILRSTGHRRPGETEGRVWTLQMGRLDKQGDFLKRLVLGTHKRRSLHPPKGILKVYREALMGFSHVHHTSINLSSLCPWKWLSLLERSWGGRGQVIYSKGKEGVRSLCLPGFSSWVHWQSYPLDDLLQQHLRKK